MEKNAGEIIPVTPQELFDMMNRLKELGIQMEQVVKQSDEIVVSIRNVVWQTYLLGLNAAIEVVQVGEIGKDGVVAEEICKLAIDSATAAQNITQTLNQMDNLIRDVSRQLNRVKQSLENEYSIIEKCC